MSLKQSMTNNKGFTIVELLIVVIVIAILATITIVSFNNITGRANQSAADAAVSTFIKKAELYAADGSTGTYPANFAVLNDATKSYHMTAGVVTAASPANSFFGTAALAQAALNADNGKNNVAVRTCGTTGLEIFAWKYVSGGTGTVNAANSVRQLGTGC